MTIFWCKIGFGECFGASFQSNHWGGHLQLSYKIHFLSHITIQWRNSSLLLGRTREDNTSKWLFWFLVISWGIHLSSFFTCPICFKCQKITEWSTLSSLVSSPVVVLKKEMATLSSVLAWRIPGTGEPGGLPSMGSQRVRHDWSDLAAAAACSCKRISFNNTLNWSLSISDWCPLNSSSTRLSFPWENFLNHHCTVCLLAIPGPNMLLMLRVVSTDLHPILTQIRKSLEFAFCLTSYP